MKTIRSLDGLDFDEIFLAFKTAFQDYEMQLDKYELNRMLERRGFVRELSFGAFVDGQLVSFTFNGIGVFRGIRTAYDTGTGTMKDFRGQGLATEIFNYSIPHLKDAGIDQYLLEVLQHNSKAISVYKNLGFQITREFNYFIQENAKVVLGNEFKDDAYTIEPVNLSLVVGLSGFHDFYPSWQNSFEAVARNSEDFIILGIFHREEPVGYCIFDPETGDITQLAIAREFRRKGLANALLQKMMRMNSHNSVKAINTDVQCEQITRFFEAKGISLKGKQFEMIRSLTHKK
ncbi:MAG: GNAT family N-acetyltransferase [Bacteroidetes bacterium]|nr:GNAT family N-acetyltransferase [Bacteroidota bacterium]